MDYKELIDRMFANAKNGISCKDVALREGAHAIIDLLSRMETLEKKAISVEEKMEEIRLVNRAKWLLIEQMKMTETEAHRHIEKQAMDRCVSKREIAIGIIRTY